MIHGPRSSRLIFPSIRPRSLPATAAYVQSAPVSQPKYRCTTVLDARFGTAGEYQVFLDKSGKIFVECENAVRKEFWRLDGEVPEKAEALPRGAVQLIGSDPVSRPGFTKITNEEFPFFPYLVDGMTRHPKGLYRTVYGYFVGIETTDLTKTFLTLTRFYLLHQNGRMMGFFDADEAAAITPFRYVGFIREDPDDTFKSAREYEFGPATHMNFRDHKGG